MFRQIDYNTNQCPPMLRVICLSSQFGFSGLVSSRLPDGGLSRSLRKGQRWNWLVLFVTVVVGAKSRRDQRDYQVKGGESALCYMNSEFWFSLRNGRVLPPLRFRNRSARRAAAGDIPASHRGSVSAVLFALLPRGRTARTSFLSARVSSHCPLMLPGVLVWIKNKQKKSWDRRPTVSVCVSMDSLISCYVYTSTRTVTR